MTIHLIWAEARDRVIGADGAIPWRIPGEQALFKQRTMGSTVVMGRLTWESLPASVRPLPGRENIVLTSRPIGNVRSVASVDEVVAEFDDFWVMGGGQVYEAFMPYAGHIVRTEVDLAVEGDAWAPAIGEGWEAEPGEWQITDTGIRWRVVEHHRAARPPRGGTRNVRRTRR